MSETKRASAEMATWDDAANATGETARDLSQIYVDVRVRLPLRVRIALYLAIAIGAIRLWLLTLVAAIANEYDPLPKEFEIMDENENASAQSIEQFDAAPVSDVVVDPAIVADATVTEKAAYDSDEALNPPRAALKFEDAAKRLERTGAAWDLLQPGEPEAVVVNGDAFVKHASYDVCTITGAHRGKDCAHFPELK